MDVYLVRHGQARHNLPDPDSCPFDPAFASIEARDHSLTETGQMQADLTGRRLSGVDFDAVLCSPFHRTLSTCAGILQHQKRHLPIEVMPHLVECWAAKHEMMPKELYLRVYDDICPIFPNDLPEDDGHTMYLRARFVADYLKERFSDEESVLIVTHGAFLCHFLTAALLGMDEEGAKRVNFGSCNCAIHKLQLHRGHNPAICVLNLTDHLGRYNTGATYVCKRPETE